MSTIQQTTIRGSDIDWNLLDRIRNQSCASLASQEEKMTATYLYQIFAANGHVLANIRAANPLAALVEYSKMPNADVTASQAFQVAGSFHKGFAD